MDVLTVGVGPLYSGKVGHFGSSFLDDDVGSPLIPDTEIAVHSSTIVAAPSIGCHHLREIGSRKGSGEVEEDEGGSDLNLFVAG